MTQVWFPETQNSGGFLGEQATKGEPSFFLIEIEFQASLRSRGYESTATLGGATDQEIHDCY